METAQTLTALDGFITFLKRSDRKPGTIKWYRNVMRHVLVDCDPLTPQSFTDYLFDLKDSGKKNSYLNHVIETIRVWGEYIGDDRYKAVKRFRQELPVIEVMNENEITKFLTIGRLPNEPLESHRRYKNFWATCAFTGARMGEIARLRVNDINFGNRSITITDGKTGARIIPLEDAVYPYLQEQVNHASHDLIFATPSGKVMSDTIWGTNFRIRLAKLGIKRHLTPYSLRHSYATDLINAQGANILAIGDILGHKKVETTKRYYHNNLTKMQQIAKYHTLNQKALSKQEKLAMIAEKLREIQAYAGDEFAVESTQSNSGLSLAVSIV